MQIMQKICKNMHNLQKICKNYASNMKKLNKKLCRIYLKIMQEMCRLCKEKHNMHRIWKKYAINIQELCNIYAGHAKICRICKKYARNMQDHDMQTNMQCSSLTNKQQVQYAEYANNLQKICKNM